MYEVVYLPIAVQDIADIARYVTEKLKAPQAAQNLLNSLSENVEILRKSPYLFRVYPLIKATSFEYRAIPVKNYIVFYTVLEESRTVEIHRMIYNKRNIAALFEKERDKEK